VSVLVVEDDQSHAELVQRNLHLASTSYEVTVVRTLESAREALERETPDLAFVDLRLPDGSGMEMLRNDHGECAYPIVIMTSQGDEEKAVKAMRGGALDYFVKTVDSLSQISHVAQRSLREWGHIQERQQAERALRCAVERYRVLYDDTPAMFFTVDSHYDLVSVNHFGAAQLGYEVAELVGQPVNVLYQTEDFESVVSHLDQCLAQTTQVHRWQARKVRKDGRVIWVRETGRMVRDAEHETAVLLVCEDITEAHELSEKLSYQASHDALTGLVNRDEFDVRLRRVLKTAQQQHEQHALCYLDLDQFKIINDTCGHEGGDELLRQLGRVLRDKTRIRDTLARLGGDEFGVLMEHCTSDQAHRIADALRATVEEFRFSWGDKSFKVGASIGLVPISDLTVSAGEVLRAADAACYAAKDEGRNRIHTYHPDDEALAKRHGDMVWAAQIQEGLERDRLRLYRQPMVRVKDNQRRELHYELLLRMLDADGQPVLPGAFLPAAERYNLAPALDRWVIETAMKWHAANPKHLERLHLCSINLSGSSLTDDALLEFVIECFDRYPTAPNRICFEITETAAIANMSGAKHFMDTLRRLGCRFALDDFGSGLSSFAYLKHLAVDILKIDGQFVKDIVHDPIDLSMVKTINEIGHLMGKQTIAEYVESPSVLAKLREIGVDYAQGYGVGRPQPLETSGSGL
jgi:diguanylate cyclase (GGDEF)-like protein/PAS domain S-box-containing protein